MRRTAFLCLAAFGSLLVLSACGDEEAATIDNGGPIHAQEDGPVDLRDTADQLSRDAQEAARAAREQASEALRDAGAEAENLWESLKEFASETADTIGDAANTVVDAADEALGGGVLRERQPGTIIGDDAPARPANDLGGGANAP